MDILYKNNNFLINSAILIDLIFILIFNRVRVKAILILAFFMIINKNPNLFAFFLNCIFLQLC